MENVCDEERTGFTLNITPAISRGVNISLKSIPQVRKLFSVKLSLYIYSNSLIDLASLEK